MSITYKSQGAGASTETSGAALSPLCPATVDAGDILIAHVFWEGTTTSPSTPAGWTLLHGPEVIQSTIARHWVFGKIADGTEDGAAVAFGSPAVTTQRGARVYSFAGRISGSITDCVLGFAATSHATDPQMPSVTTTIDGSLAVALVAQNDNNAFASPTGESGGDWVEAVAEYTVALTPGLSLGIETAAMASIGTISGGSMATTNDPCGVIGFEVRDSVPVISATLSQTDATDSLAGTATLLIQGAVSQTDAEDVALATATVLIQAALSLTDDADTLAGTFTVQDPQTLAELNLTDDADAISAQAQLGIAAVLALTDDADVLASAAALALLASLALTDDADVPNSSASLRLAAVLALTDDADVLSSAAALSLIAQLSRIDDNDVLVAEADTGAPRSAVLDLVDGNDTLSAAATVPQPAQEQPQSSVTPAGGFAPNRVRRRRRFGSTSWTDAPMPSRAPIMASAFLVDGDDVASSSAVIHDSPETIRKKKVRSLAALA